jgi:transposase
MTLQQNTIGIDVSKTALDVFFAADGRSERIANASEPIAALARRCRSLGGFVLFEATGRYDAKLRKAFGAAGVAFARVNPARARDFVRAAGFLAKTDKVDARMLARMAAVLQPQAEPQADPAREQLALLQRRRDQLVAACSQERIRRAEADSFERDSLDRHLAWLSGEIDRFDKLIAKLLAASAALKEAFARLCTAPGVGPVTATTLLALLPELGQRSPKAVAALAGLAPLNRDSGQFRGARHIGGGRARVRVALYMAAVSATRSNTRFQACYKAMRAAGKAPKVALIAVARKILLALNAMLRDRVAFRP